LWKEKRSCLLHCVMADVSLQVFLSRYSTDSWSHPPLFFTSLVNNVGYYGAGRWPYEGTSAGTYAFTGTNNPELGGIPYVSLGDLGGQNDKVWRTAVYEIAPAALKAEDGRFKFSIGYPAPWGRSTIYGEVRVDWIKLSDEPIEPDPDVAGLWPQAETDNNFKSLPATGFLVDGQPFFPIILYVNDGVTSAREDSYDLFKRAGFNVLAHIIHEEWPRLSLTRYGQRR